MALRKNEGGFTLLSSLMAIMIIGLILPLIANLYQTTATLPTYTEEISIQQFFQFLRDDLSEGVSYQVKKDELQITLYDGTLVTIEKYNDLIRRQVNRKGHEIYLRDIENVFFKKIPYGISASIISSKGVKYEKHIVFYP